jgi:hypothetical protein
MHREKVAARGVPKSTPLSAPRSAVQLLGQIHNITPGDYLASIVFQNVDEVSESIERWMGRRFFARGVKMP